MANSITISVIGDVRNLVSGVDQAEGKLGKLGKVAGGLGKLVAGGLAVAGAAFVAFGVSSVKSLARIETINAQTAAAVKSTGGVAGASAKHIETLTGKLEDLTATEAETTQENANLLLTFTNVRNEVGKGNDIFDRTVSTFVDMQRAVPSASMVGLGKALNDPIKGISALSRVGVSFTAQQKEQIKTLVDSGRTLDAQKIILGELNKEFGGSGKAFAATTTGKIELAKHAFGTLGETIFAGVLPPLGQLAGAAVKGLRWANEQLPAVQAFASELGDRFAPSLAIASDFLAQVGNVVTGQVAPAIAGFLPTLADLAGTFTGDILPAVTAVAGYLIANAVPIFVQLAGIITGQVLPVVQSMAAFFVGTLVPIIVSTATAVAGKLKPILDQVYATIQTQLLPTVSKVVAKFTEWQPTIQRTATTLAKAAGVVITFGAAILGKVLPPLIRFSGFMIANVVPAVFDVIGVVIKVVAKIVEFGAAMVTGARIVGQKIGSIVKFFESLDDKIKGAIGNAAGMLLTIGGQIIDGLKAGIEGAAHKVMEAVQSVVNRIPKKIRELMGIASPSKVTTRLGEFISGGLAAGIDNGTPGVESSLATLTSLIEKSVETDVLAAAKKAAKGKKIDKAKVDDRAEKKAKTVLKTLRGQYAAIKANAAAQDEVNGRLDEANTKLTAATDAYDQYAATVRDSVVSFGSLGNLAQGDGFGSVDQLIALRQAKIDQAAQYTGILEQLTAASLNKTDLQELIDLGVSGGLGTAQAILAGGPATIAALNNQSTQLITIGTKLGTNTADTFKAAGVQTAQGLVAGIQSELPALEAAATQMGNTLAKAVKKALKIKSPSRVFRDLGRFVPLGLVGGVDAVDVAPAGQQLATDLVTGFGRPALNEPRLKLSPDAIYTSRNPSSSDGGGYLHLTADQLSLLEQGKRVTIAQDAYLRAGGRRSS